MLREPTPEFMLRMIQQLRQDGYLGANLERNVRWLVTGDGRPVGCPEGTREDQFLERLEEMRVECEERLSNLVPDNQERSILDELEARLNSINHENQMCEIAFNNSLSRHFENHEEDHALVRWLLEGEFLETEHNGEIDCEPNRTVVVDDYPRVCDLPLHISSNWDPHGQNGPGTMGPAARLLCYWVRGEYLGSCSVTELNFVASDQHSDFELRHEATAPHRDGNRVTNANLRRRVRLHALAKIEVFTLVTSGDNSERWVLRDSSANRYQHGLSESLMPGESFLECALRGLKEELGVDPSTIPNHQASDSTGEEPSRILNRPVPYGPTRVEWGGGGERFDSRSMPGLPSIMCINPFYAEFDSNHPESEHDFVKLKDGIPTRQFVIDDAGGTTLNWLPDLQNLNLEETLALIGDNQDIQTNQWYALNFPKACEFQVESVVANEKDEKTNKQINSMIGATFLHHHMGDVDKETLIQERDCGLLYTLAWTKRNARKPLGIQSFISQEHELSQLVSTMASRGIIEPATKDKTQGFLESIGRLLQPSSELFGNGKTGFQWLRKSVHDSRNQIAKKCAIAKFDKKDIMRARNRNDLLPWDPLKEHTSLNDEAKTQLSLWHNSLKDIFDKLNNSELWEFDGTLASLLRNQPDLEGPRTVILFKRLDDGSFDVKLQEKVNLPVAQLHSALLNHLRRREEEQSSLDTLDEVTSGSIRDTVNELRERHAMVVRLD